MTFESVEEVLDYAIKREQEAQAFYKEVSQQEAFAGSKEMFLEFADEERKHETLLKSIKEKDKPDKVEKYKFKWIPDLKRSNYVVDLEYQAGMGYNEVLMLAMKREEKALALYNDMLGKSETDDLKNIFKMLCQEEAKHKLKLETLYDDYMAEMGD